MSTCSYCEKDCEGLAVTKEVNSSKVKKVNVSEFARNIGSIFVLFALTAGVVLFKASLFMNFIK